MTSHPCSQGSCVRRRSGSFRVGLALLLPLAILSACRSGPGRPPPPEIQPAPAPRHASLLLLGGSLQAEVSLGELAQAQNGPGPGGRGPGRPSGLPPEGFGDGPPGGRGGSRGAPIQPPGLSLQVVFRNVGTQSLECAVGAVESPLGRFAAVPPRIALAPGQSVAMQPMLGNVDPADPFFPVTLTVRQAGQEESRTLDLGDHPLPRPTP